MIKPIACFAVFACILIQMGLPWTHTAFGREPYVITGEWNHFPFTFTDEEGRVNGILVDIWRLWSEKNGIPIEYQTSCSIEAYHKVLKGDADIIGGMIPFDDYNDLFDFSIPILNLDYFIFYRKDLKGVEKLSDLTPFRIGVVEGGHAEIFLRRQSAALDLAAFSSMKALIGSAFNGDLLVFIGSTQETLFHLGATGEGWRFKMSETPLISLQLCAAVKKGRHNHLGMINKGFASISKREIDSIEKRWSGNAIGHQIPWPLLSFGAMLIAGAATAVFLWFWNYQLKNKVSLATADLQIKHQQLEQSESALRKSEEKYKALYAESKRAEDLYRSLLDSSADAIVIYNLDGYPTFVNPSFTRIFGWKLEDVENRRIPFVPVEEIKKTESIIESILNHETPHHGFETKRFTKDGRIVDVSVSTSCCHDHEGNTTGLLAVIRDISETKKLEARLRQAQKMEAIGTLAGGVAHDFNNILSAVMGYTELALRNTQSDDQAYPYLQQISKACDRAADLVRQILSFSRQGEIEPQPIKISPIVKEALKLIRASLPSTVEIQTCFNDQKSTVNADPTQIHQVLMNLCTNAHHALRDTGGVLKVGLDVAEFTGEEPFLLHSNIEAESFVKLTVSDTGPGMDKNTLERIFDPYFTTKAKSEGTGLGLAVVQGIVAAHGGALTVSSRINKGTTFSVFLPRIDESESETVEMFEEKALGGHERILFVDDEESIVEIGQEILSYLGYEVTTVTKSPTALKMVEESPERFDLVISDMTMPHLTGYQLAEKILEIRPDIPIVICTGYSDAIDSEAAIKLGVQELLMKPVNFNVLAQKIRKYLNENKSAV